jgi:hypothetical protein
MNSAHLVREPHCSNVTKTVLPKSQNINQPTRTQPISRGVGNRYGSLRLN